MDEASYHTALDQLFAQVEDALDEKAPEVDIESAAGILTLTFPDGSALILSRQTAARELWVAAKSGGYHLRHEAGQWQVPATAEPLSTLLNRVITDQLGREVELLGAG